MYADNPSLKIVVAPTPLYPEEDHRWRWSVSVDGTCLAAGSAAGPNLALLEANNKAQELADSLMSLGAWA